MKRSVWSLAALLFGTIGMAHADYVLIRINLGVQQPPAAVPVVGQPVLPPALGGFRPPIQPPPPPPKGVVVPPLDLSNRLSAVALVEYSKFQRQVEFDKNTGKNVVKRVYIDTRWGKVNEIVVEPETQLVKTIETVWYDKKQTMFHKFETQHKDLMVSKDKTAAKYLELADFALTNGLVNKVPEVLAEMKSLDLTNDKDAARAKAVLDAFEVMARGLLKTPTRDDMPVAWRVGNLKSDSSDHYTLFFDSTGGVTPETRQRLARLEDNCRAFYFWFALRGHALPAPERRQVAILLDRPMEFRQYLMAFGGPQMIADGCYAARENVAVFSAVPLDDSYDVISRTFKDLLQNGWNFKTLIKGVRPPTKTNLDEIAYAQTMALVSKALHEESEHAAVSHHGTRQMLTASGILPRTVVLPQWLSFGFPAAFETPKFSRETQTGAFWPTYGAPHWVYLIQWQEWLGQKTLDPPEQAILDVIGDGYFRRASQGDPAAVFKARTMAWSLAYFLVQRRLDGMLRYCQELGQLPRDLELDDEVYRGCFARAFGLTDPSGDINPAKLNELAKEWYSFIGISRPPQYPEMLKDAQNMRELMKKPAPKP